MSSGLSGLLIVTALIGACVPMAATSGQQPQPHSVDQHAAPWVPVSRLGAKPGTGLGGWLTPGLVFVAQGGECTASCRSAYNQCRVQTKGHPSCDSQFTSCMQRCIPKGR